MDPSEAWEQAILILKRTGYQIKLHGTEAVVMEEKYSPDLNVCLCSSYSFLIVDGDFSLWCCK